MHPEVQLVSTFKCDSLSQGIRVTAPDLIAPSNSSLQYFTHRFKVEINFSEKNLAHKVDNFKCQPSEKSCNFSPSVT